MTKIEFKKIMTELKALAVIEDELNVVIKKLCSDFNFISFGRYEQLVLDMLKIAMDDRHGWLCYFIYDMEWGSRAKKNTVTEEGKNIPIKTLDNLYDLLVSYKK